VSLAPDDRIGVFVLTNTGGLSGRGASAPVANALPRRVLGLVGEGFRTDIPARPDVWGELCGWYRPDPGPVTNLPIRAAFGAGLEVTVHRGGLTLRPLTPVPVMGSMRLHPDDPADPRVFRIASPEFGSALPVAFSRQADDGATTTRLVLNLYSFQKRPDRRRPSSLDRLRRRRR
jgi:hypothetical protein